MLGCVTDIVTDHTLRTIAMGAGTLGIVSGALGAFAVLRKQSLLGDAMSHAALPGIVLAFIIFRARMPLLLLLGAAAAGWIATALVGVIVRTTRIKNDAALGMILSVFFGVGLVLMTYVQKIPDARQAGLEKFLFGQAAAMMTHDVIITTVAGCLVIAVVTLLWKEFKIVCFDAAYAESLGFPVRTVEALLTSLIVIAIVLGLQMVGVILMSAMIVAPAAASRQWTDRLSVMVILAGAFGAFSGITGAVISSSGAHLPTGPVIVICMMAVTVLSLLLAPRRGLVWRHVAAFGRARRIRRESILRDLYYLAQQHEDVTHSHTTAALRAMTFGEVGVKKNLRTLSRDGLVVRTGTHQWALTERGAARARDLIRATSPA